MVSFASRPESIYPKTDSATSPIPDELTRWNQWVCWRYEWKPKQRRWDKVPYDPSTRRRAKTNDPSTWGSFEQALAVAEEFGYEGIGFVLSGGDPFTGIDFDKCRDKVTGEIHPWVNAILDRLATYAEVSPSGTGVKAILIGEKPGNKCKREKTPWGGAVEIYEKNRFFTITGNVTQDHDVRPAQATLDNLYSKVFSEAEKKTTERSQPTVYRDDAEVLELARTKGKHDLFKRLYDRGDWSGFGSWSDADFAACGTLAYYSGGDTRTIDRLFRSSGLMREKWDQVHHADGSTYGERTIERAVASVRRFYTGEGRPAPREVRQILQPAMEQSVFGTWDGASGDTARDVLRAHINTALSHGKATADGAVEYALALTEAMLDVSVGDKGTARRAHERLIEEGYLEVVRRGRGEKATIWRLKASPRFTPNSNTEKRVFMRGGITATVRMRHPYTPPRKLYDRAGRKIPAYVGAPVKRVPRRVGHVVDIVSHSELQAATLSEIAAVLGKDTRDGRHKVKTRLIRPAIDHGLLEEITTDHYAIPADVEEALAQYLKDSGCDEKARLDRAAVERDRAARKKLLRELREGKALGGPQEVDTDPVQPLEPVQKDTAPPELTDPLGKPTEVQDETPCKHSGLGYVFLGGNGCYMCDPDHPLRQHERERGVIDLDAYRREKAS